MDLHITQQVSESGVIRGLHVSPFYYRYKKIATPVYENRWSGLVNDSEVHTESDALEYRNETRKT